MTLFMFSEIRHGPGKPGAWCDWVPTDNGRVLQPEPTPWNGSEKFGEYIPWLAYLIKTFLAPWGKSVNGLVGWQGEEASDYGQIRVTKNIIETRKGEVTYGKWVQFGY